MNYLAHGWRFTANPYYLAGTAAPDWMSVIDRKVRLRSKTAAQFSDDSDSIVSDFARGVMQHHWDDAWFHESPAFNELSLAFAVEIRERLPGDEGFRPSFLGHILVELLLDRAIAEEDPRRLDAYYAALGQINAGLAARAIERVATRPSGQAGLTERVETLIPRFIAERFLYDYLDDGKLLTRLNHVMRRVGLPQLPADLVELFPDMRLRVNERMNALLAGTKPGPGEL